MKTMLITYISALALTLAGFGSAVADPSMNPGNRISCNNPFTGETHYTPAECVRDVGEYVNENWTSIPLPEPERESWKGVGHGYQYFKTFSNFEKPGASNCIHGNCNK